MEHETVEKITGALQSAGFTGIETRKSSSTVTVSAQKEGITAVLHLTDTKAPPTVRTARLGTVPDFTVKAFAPGAGVRSGSGN
jgi:hypothetical protein